MGAERHGGRSLQTTHDNWYVVGNDPRVVPVVAHHFYVASSLLCTNPLFQL